MENFLEKFDRLAAVETENSTVRWLERVTFALMILMFVAAPHSIALMNIGWLGGTFVWIVRQFFKPRRTLVRTALDVPLWLFFGWSLVSSIFSYDPATSLDKVRLSPALFLIFYFVINVVKTKRAAVFLALAMISSAMLSVAWTPIERIIGRGVQISGVSAESPLAKAILLDGDTLLKANDKKIRSPEEIADAMQANETTKLYVYRPDFYFTVEVKKADLLNGANASEQLGIADWKRGRNWRSAGFYGHYTTFAEVLQLIASLTFGLFIASLGKRFSPQRRRDAEILDKENFNEGSENSSPNLSASPRRKISASMILLVCLGGMLFALLLTVTRASQLGFLISAATIVFVAGSRKMFLTLAAVVLPVALVGLFFLQQSRQVGFFDSSDNSTTWRQTVWREGLNLWTANPRHFFLGVGMDSIKKYAVEWHLFDDGRLPAGHFHSTPIQLLVERGLPALLLWLWILGIYCRTLLRYLKTNAKDETDWRMRGIILGCLGGTIGFFVGGFVHYNLGDAEVAMVFFMLTGLSVSLINNHKTSINTGSKSLKTN